MLRRTRLYEIVDGQQVVFTEYAGWELPLRIQDLNQDYSVLNDKAGLLDLSCSGVLEVSGKDSARFLHGVLTNDIQSLQSGQGCYAAMLSPQGRAVADMQVYHLEESLLLTTDTALREKLPSALRKYLIGNRAEVCDQSECLGLLSIQGPLSSEFLDRLGVRPLPTQDYGHVSRELLDTEIRICRMKRTRHGGFDLLVPQERLSDFWKALVEKGKEIGILPVGFEALNIHRIEAGIPQYGKDMDESNILVEVGLQSAISFTKGCYIGQEIVARATFVGHVNRRLTGLLLSGNDCPPSKSKIFQDEKEVGWITSSAFSPGLNSCILLGYLRREALEPGTKAWVERAGQLAECTVVSLPFIKN